MGSEERDGTLKCHKGVKALFRGACLSALALIPATSWATGTGTLMPDMKRTFLDNGGIPCPSCRVFFYVSGTTTKQTAYSDGGLSVALANPSTVDSAGRIAAGGPFFPSGTAFKIVLAPAGTDDPPNSPIWTQDTVSAVPGSSLNLDIDGTAGEALTAGNIVYLSDGSGGQTAGRWYKVDADFTYASTLPYALGAMPADLSSGSTGSVRIQGRITGLTSLSTATLYYVSATAGALTSSAPTNSRVVGVADSSTSLVLSQWSPSSTYASSTLPGLVSTGTQTIAGDKTGSGQWTFSKPPLYNQGTSSTADATVSGKVCFDHTASNGATGAGTDYLASCTLHANSISAAGKMFRLTAHGTLAANANNKTWTFSLGGTALLTFPTVAANNYDWTLIIEVARTTSTANETLTYTLVTGPVAGGGGATVYKDRTTGTKDLTTDLIVKGTIISGTASGDIKFDFAYVEVIG